MAAGLNFGPSAREPSTINTRAYSSDGRLRWDWVSNAVLGEEPYFGASGGTLDISDDGRTAVVAAELTSYDHELTPGPRAIGYTSGGWLVVALDVRSGKEKWAEQSLEPLSGALGSPWVETASGVNQVVVTHARGPSSLHSYATTSYDLSTGEQLWSARFGQSGESSNGLFVAIDPGGSRAYVTGFAHLPEQSSAYRAADIETVAYDL